MCGSAMPRGLGGDWEVASEEGEHVCGSRQWMCAHVHHACRHVHVVPAFGVGNIRCRARSAHRDALSEVFSSSTHTPHAITLYSCAERGGWRLDGPFRRDA